MSRCESEQTGREPFSASNLGLESWYMRMSHRKHWHGVRQPTNIPATVTFVNVPDGSARAAIVRDRSYSRIYFTVGEFVLSGTILEIQFDTCLIRGRVQNCREV